MALTDKFTSLADIIRNKKGTTDTYTLDQMISEFTTIAESSGEVVDKYEIADKIVSGNGTLTEYNSTNVTKVRSSTFSSMNSLVNVNLPNAVNIGANAFEECRNIETLNLGVLSNVYSRSFYATGASNRSKTDVTPFDITYNGDTTLAASTFAYSNLGSITSNSVTTLGGVSVFQGCTNLKTVNLPNLTTITQSYCFDGCSSIEHFNAPNLTTISAYTFQNAMKDGSTLDLECLLDISDSAFRGCKSTKYIFRDLTNIQKYAFHSSNITDLTFYGRSLVTVSTSPAEGVFYNTPMRDSTGETKCYIRVRSNLIDKYKNDSNWQTVLNNPNIEYVAINDEPINAIYISPFSSINLYTGDESYATKQLVLEFNEDDLAAEDQRGVTFEILEGDDLFDIDENGLLTAKVNTDIGESRQVTVKVTSTVDTSVTAQISFVTMYKELRYSIELNDGQFVDSGETVDDYIVYKSDAGSYYINDGASYATVTFVGYTSFTVVYKSYSESGYDYILVGALDVTDISRDDRNNVSDKTRVVGHTKSYNNTYLTYTFEIQDKGEHSFTVMYSKDSSGNKYDDRGYFYVYGE